MGLLKRQFGRVGRANKKPFDIGVVGIDGAGKSTLSLGLKQALQGLNLNAKIINVPYYSDLQGYAFFRWLSRKSKEIISRGARRKNKITLLVGSVMAVLPFRISKSLTKRADVRIYERHPTLEGGIFEVYGKGLGNTMMQVGKATGGFAPQLVIFMKVVPEIAAERIAADRTRTGKWRGAEFPHEKLENLRRMQSAYERTISLLKKTYGNKIAVVEINGTEPVGKNIQGIVQKLKELGVIAG